jgi:putative redox protein
VVPTQAQVYYIQGHLLIGKANSNHWVPFDTAPHSGGDGGAADPAQYLVMACAGCSAIDITDFLKKSRKHIRAFSITVEAIRFPVPPKIVRQLNYHVVVEAEGVDDDLIRRATHLSLTKYCSVSLSLDRSVTFHVRATVNGREIPTWEVPRDDSLFARAWPTEPQTP